MVSETDRTHLDLKKSRQKYVENRKLGTFKESLRGLMSVLLFIPTQDVAVKSVLYPKLQ